MIFSLLIVDTYYHRFLQSFYARNPSIVSKSYFEHKDLIMSQSFGTADYYSSNLKKLGYEAEEIIANNEVLQKQWAKENGIKVKETVFLKVLRRIPHVRRFVKPYDWLFKVLEAQIKKAKPDILYVQDLSFCPPFFLREMKRHVRYIIGQIACPLPPLNYLKPYDLILTSFPHYVDRFRKMGIKCEYFKIAFEPSVLERIQIRERKYPCTFVGGISRVHKNRIKLLEELARRTDIEFFGYGADTLAKSSPIRPRHHGEVWGLDMYSTLLSSKITVNRHIDVAEGYANNMRLYESTGCGAMLITDYKDNLNELFEIGKEVVAYRNTDELVDLIRYYEEHEEERKQIAKAGQKRTLGEHTYHNRMSELVEIIDEAFR